MILMILYCSLLMGEKIGVTESCKFHAHSSVSASFQKTSTSGGGILKLCQLFSMEFLLIEH